jgi:tetratricopeptide (TPR) repeat protein
MKTMKLFFVVAGFLFLTGFGKSDLQQGKDYFLACRSATNATEAFTLYNKAIESFTRAIQSNPRGEEAYFFRGASYLNLGQFDPALGDFTKTIEINPHNAEAYWNRGYCYANKRMDDKAIADYTESLKLKTKMEGMVYELRAGAHFRKKMWNEAENDLNFILILKPGDPKTLAALEEVKKMRSDPTFDPQALKYRPINEQPAYGEMPPTNEMNAANERYITTVIQTHKTKEAALKEVLKEARRLYDKGDYSTSMKRFNQAWLLDDNNPEAFHGFALILRAWGYNNEAEKWEKRAVDGGYREPLK